MKQFNTSSTPENSFHKAIIVAIIFCCLVFANSVNAQSESTSGDTKANNASRQDAPVSAPMSASALTTFTRSDIPVQPKEKAKKNTDLDKINQSGTSENPSTQDPQKSSPDQNPASSALSAQPRPKQ